MIRASWLKNPQEVSPRFAEAALLVATLVWGSSFTWAKHGGGMINGLTGAGAHGLIGPTLLLSVRFTLAGLVWLLIFPAARRGWSWTSAYRGLVLGVIMGGGLLFQVLGLDRTTEALSAFLTSLTILWVPLMMTLWLRQPPKPIFWAGVGLASAGIWLMTGAMPSGFGSGELLGLGCSIAFSVQIIVVNRWMPLDDPFRITAAEFLITGLVGGVASLIMARGAGLQATALLAATGDRAVIEDVLLLVAGPTLISYGCMSIFQPRVDATRATLIYLLEPIVAGGYAWLSIGRKLSPLELGGGGMILSANLLVEIVTSRRQRNK